MKLLIKQDPDQNEIKEHFLKLKSEDYGIEKSSTCSETDVYGKTSIWASADQTLYIKNSNVFPQYPNTNQQYFTVFVKQSENGDKTSAVFIAYSIWHSQKNNTYERSNLTIYHYSMRSGVMGSCTHATNILYENWNELISPLAKEIYDSSVTGQFVKKVISL